MSASVEIVEILTPELRQTSLLLGDYPDIAVLHLAEPVTSVVPFDIAGFESPAVGKAFVAMGYGISTVSERGGWGGVRMMGKQTVRAEEGRELRSFPGLA